MLGAAALVFAPAAAAEPDNTEDLTRPTEATVASNPPAPPATTGGHDPTFTIDDAALRQQLRPDPTTRRAPGERDGDRPDPLHVVEQEAPTVRGDNDTLPDAERIRGFGTTGKRNPGVRFDGTLATDVVEPVAVAPNEEDDGAIPLAADTGLGDELPSISTTGRIGDGPHGSAGTGTGDFDFYRVDAEAGRTLTIEVTAPVELFAHAVVYDTDGEILVGGQDMTADGAFRVSYPIVRDGIYFVAIGSYYMADPFDAGSGFGVIGEGPYGLELTLAEEDTDVVAVRLRPGDVVGGTVTGAARRLAVYDGRGSLVQASILDSSPIYPAASPLPGGGNATIDHVAAYGGWHYVAVSGGSGDYTAWVDAYRPPGERADRPQTIFLDFDGATIDNRIFGGAAIEPGERELSPFADFLPAWGLSASDEAAVIDAVTERFTEQLRHEIDTKVRVLSSKDHPDPFGRPDVSRIIIGGTVEEAGIIPVIGIAQSIDPGNFDREETALVLLDNMSAPADQPISLNAYMTEDSDRVQAVGQAIANVSAHEAGHYLGNWHQDDLNDIPSIMSTGNLMELYSLGPDGIAGTTDDTELSMVEDRFDLFQGFSGSEDTATRTRYALR